MALPQPKNKDNYPDLWGLTANEVANRKSSALLSLQEYHLGPEDEALKSEVRTIKNVAFYPLHLLLNDLPPFNYSVKADDSTPQAFLSVFQNSIKLYQLYTFYVYAISELGSIHGDEILNIQSKQLNKWFGNQQGDVLSARFDDITTAAKQHAKQHASSLNYMSLDIPVENTISRTFLLTNRDSPLYISDDKQGSPTDINFRGIDLALAEHLGHAKDLALQVYSRFFNSVIVKV